VIPWVLLLSMQLSLAAITATATVSNTAPSISNIWITETTGTPVSSLDPATEYYIIVNVTDSNSLKDIENITLTLYNNSLNSPDSTRYHYTFKFDNDTLSFSEIGPGNTHLITADCSYPTLTNVYGNYTFAIRLNETAIPSTWVLWVNVTDSAGNKVSKNVTFSVNEYISASLDDSSLTFSGSPGTNDVPASENPTVVTVKSNVNFSIQVKGSGDFVGSTDSSFTIPLSYLTFDDDSTPSESTETGLAEKSCDTVYQILYSNVGYGYNVAKNIYWFLDIPNGILAQEYTTTIYVGVFSA